MTNTRNGLSIQQIQNDLSNITFKTRSQENIKLTFDISIENKFGCEFGEIVNTPQGPAIALGENDNQLWFFVIGEPGISYWDNFKHIKQTLGFSKTFFNLSTDGLLHHLYPISNYKEMLNKRKREEKLSKMSVEEVRDYSATTIQKVFKGVRERRKYGIPFLPRSDRSKFPTYVIGNDPDIAEHIKEKHKRPGKIALVGISGLRSLAIACQLSDNVTVPKIIIVDDSHNVYQFWHAFKNFMEIDAFAQTKDKFLAKLPEFLNNVKSYYADFSSIAPPTIENVNYLDQHIPLFLENVINTYGYDFVRSTVMHTSFISQDWADPVVFNKLRNILNYLAIENVYIYASNIASCVPSNVRMQVLENIEKVNPALSIHTNLCSYHRIPEEVYLFSNNNKNAVANQLFFQGNNNNNNNINVINFTQLQDFIHSLRTNPNSNFVMVRFQK